MTSDLINHDNKLVVTRTENVIYSVLFNNKTSIEINCYKEGENILNNIYICAVREMVKYLNAAFVEYSKGKKAYLPINEYTNPFYTKKGTCKTIAAGDELLIQISKEGIKTKDPVATTNLSFTGKYLVLTTEKTMISFSNKITDNNWKHNVKKELEVFGYGFIVRTNAYNISMDILLDEAKNHIANWEQIKAKAPYRSCYSLINEAPKGYVTEVIGSYKGVINEIITDDKEIYENIYSILDKSEKNILRFYDDNMLSLKKLYSIDKNIEDATRKNVWLKSGAYLIIEPTEALTVIDVNTGKMVTKKKNKEALLKVNMEAAKEIAHSIRLRNISGIIIVDFINMQFEEDNKTLLDYLYKELLKDPVKCSKPALTSLGLIEFTRKKIKKSLKEQIK